MTSPDTLKLYFSSGACSLAPHIALHEAGLTFEAITAPLETHKLHDGSDYYSINPLGYVPLLELNDGRRLRECAAILQYSFERFKLQEWLTFTGTELHQKFSILFNPAATGQIKAAILERLRSRLTWVDSELAKRAYTMGEGFTVADGYLFTVTNWAQYVGLDLSSFANLQTFRNRVGARPKVIAAMKAEGLIA